MQAFLDSLKGIKLWQIGVLAAVLAATAGATYGVYAFVTSSGGTGIGDDQQLVPVQLGNLVNSVSLSGSVVFPERESLGFGTQGTVGEVHVEVGDSVTQGQPLASLDAATMASLEMAAARARLDLKEAEEALEKARNPSALALATAESKAADARLALRDAQERLDALLNPTLEDTTRAESNVIAASLAVEAASEALAALEDGPSSDDLSKARARVDSAKVSLANAEGDLALSQRDWDGKLEAAQDAFDKADDEYSGAFLKWLGAELTEEELNSPPDTLLASWDADLTAIFGGQRFEGLSEFTTTQVPSLNDPNTRWDESIVFIWLSFYPGNIIAACNPDDRLFSQDVCVQRELEGAWEAFEAASQALDSSRVQASRAVSSAQDAVTRSQDALAESEEALADLRDGADSLEVESKRKALTLAEVELAKAQDALDLLQNGGDELEVASHRRQAEVAQANLDEAELALAELKNSADTIEVALREAELASAQSALESALARLDDAVLEAPFDGVVTAVNVGAGDAVNANIVAVEVLDPTIAEVNGIADEIDVLFLSVGASAFVTMDALPGQALQGTVSAISSEAQSQQGVVSYPVRVRLTLPDGIQLREGLSAVASVMLTQEEGILVPSQAIRGSFQQPTVQVLEDGRIEDRLVSLGNSDDFWTIVNEGLEPGEQVVIDTPEGSSQFTGLGGLRQIQGLQGTFGAPGGGIQVVPGTGGGGRQFFQQQQGGGR
ncbi:MAG: efflux RND transporter periplasmic adaptor subunit [Chloroflexi bacterium]|nr:efflux RND transporter periplasmic adaptor subunit [Chloroflexota bacterium]